MPLNRREFLQAGLAAALPPLPSPAASLRQAASPVPAALPDEDGYELWLRYRPVRDSQLLAHYRAATAFVVQRVAGPMAQSITDELSRACQGMLARNSEAAQSVTAGGTILIGTPDASPEIRQAIDATDLAAAGNEGFILRTLPINGHTTIVIAANHERGLLYGAFALITRMQLGQRLDALAITSTPRANIRMVNHWDNLSRTVERGYAGLSIFHFDDLAAPNPRYIDYARALASIGINGTVINNVNASPAFLDGAMLPGYHHLANTLRAWGITLYLSANYASPISLTAHDSHPLSTADPLDPAVQAWWSRKADEIYQAIPDFGGFLMKANSEGEPGPLTYNRTHAQGANMLARALKPHGGIVIWRTFVHGGFPGWSEDEYRTFHPLDGEFDANVILQTKNGPIDFLVREPVNPLFGAMPRTNQMIELQITQEYTGHATHLCYLPSYWSDVLAFDTHHAASGPTVADVIDGTADRQPLTGFAGVSNFGDDRNWTGSFLASANAHGFGRLAWDHSRDVREIAAEWVTLTFGPDPEVVAAIVPMLLSSWRTYERYTSPFGVGYLMRPNGAHFEPDPRGTEHMSHFTSSQGSGFDRTLATGSGFTRLYSDYWFHRYETLETCPEELMMFMHIVPWEHRLANGKTTIQQVYDDHFAGVEEVLALARAWTSLAGKIDQQRHDAVSQQFDQQLLQARIWRDVLMSYYFDNARIISADQPWVQVAMLETRTFENPALLLGGTANDTPLRLTNATGTPQDITVDLARPQGSWQAKPTGKTLAPRESNVVSLTVTPPLEPYNGPLDFASAQRNLMTLGLDTQIVIVTPAAEHCTYAFDVGSAPNTVVTGYQALTAHDLWQDGSSRVGWVGVPPQDTRMATNWDLLQVDCASDGAPRTLRMRLAPGKQRAWVLIGGEGSGTQPVRLTMGQETLVQTGYIVESMFQWSGFTLDGGADGKTIDMVVSGADGRYWRLAALVVLKPGL